MLDLVHPSLFPYIKYVSPTTSTPARPVYKFIGGGTVEIKKTFTGYISKPPSTHSYQWLPSEFDVDNKGHAHIKSYINNLHPVKHKKLYSTIAEVFSWFVPLFEKVLTDLTLPRYLRAWVGQPESNGRDDDDGGDYNSWYRPSTREKFSDPYLPPFDPYLMPKSYNPYTLRGKRLQVILASRFSLFCLSLSRFSLLSLPLSLLSFSLASLSFVSLSLSLSRFPSLL